MAVSSDHGLGARFGALEGLTQVRQQLGKQWDLTRRAVRMVRRLRAVDGQEEVLPVDIAPSQGEVLRRAPQSTVATQREDQAPLGIRARLEHPVGIFEADEVAAIRVALNR